MQLIAMYLPQFHRVPENDMWWGDGFTDWDAARKAKRLFPEHEQPRIPLHNNFYDLMQKDTMRWQEELLHRYGLDGFCFYHYWFKDGRRILEKPAENLLHWKSIDIPFCFCWANESWARSWSNIRSINVWANTFEDPSESHEGNGLLLEQIYGDEGAWREHFMYLLPFFKDNRYIKIDRKPVLMLYATSHISCVTQMMRKWREWAIEEGLLGLYVIGRNIDVRSSEAVDAVYYQQPQVAMGEQYEKVAVTNGYRIFDYNESWDIALKYRGTWDVNAYYGGFVDYDDSPRRGIAAQIMVNVTPEAFRKNMTAVMLKNHSAGAELTFINAWNEWGEGMYLEPDEKNEYAYLEALKQAKEDYNIYMRGIVVNPKHDLQDAVFSEKVFNLEKQSAKRAIYRDILDRWLMLYEANPNFLVEWLEKRESKKISIYGLGILGKHLLRELENTQIEVCYGIDQYSSALSMGIPMYSLQDILPYVDLVIVTVFYDYDSIAKELRDKGLKPVSVEDLIFEELSV